MASFIDFGAVGDGVTDDTLAIEYALASGQDIINESRRPFKCTKVIAENVNIFLRGGRILGQIEITNTQAVRTDIDGLEFVASVYGGTGLKITHSPELCLLRRDVRLVRIGDGVTFSGIDADTGGYQTALWLKDVNRAKIGAVQIQAQRPEDEYMAGSRGIVIEGTVQPVLTEIDNPHIRHVEMAVHLSGNMEGVSVDRPRIPSCRWGVYADWTSINPSFRVTNGHINARERCVKMKNTYEAKIAGNEFQRFVNVAGPGAWAGVEMIGADRNLVIGNTFSGDPAPLTKPKNTPSHAIRLGAGVLRSQSAHNRGYGIDAGIFGTGDLSENGNVWE